MAAGYDQTWMAVHEVYELYNCSIRNYYIFQQYSRHSGDSIIRYLLITHLEKFPNFKWVIAYFTLGARRPYKVINCCRIPIDYSEFSHHSDIFKSIDDNPSILLLLLLYHWLL